MKLTLFLLLVLAPVQDAEKKPVDLVPLLDADKDSIVGDWTIENGVLASPKRARPPRIHLLQIPYVPPAEYDLTLVVESRGPFDPKGETTSLDVGLPFGEARTLMVLDGWNGSIGGLMGIGGKTANDNETKLTNRVFTDGTPRTLVFSVRKQSITITLDGKPLVDWKGSPSDIQGSVYDGQIPDRRAFYLGAWIGYTFRKVQLTPLGGPGTVVARRTKSKLVGGGGGGDFDDTPTAPSLLVGLRYWRAQYGASPIVKCVQGLYRGEEGPSEGRVSGVPRTEPAELLARPGYAVGAIVAKGGSRVDGFKVVFMRIGEKGLDPKDSYESDWIGGRGGGDETTLGGDGVPVVGLCGRSGEDLDCVGVVQAHVPETALDPMRAIAEKLKSPNADDRIAACKRLRRMGPEALVALDSLIDLLRGEPLPLTAEHAAAVIGDIGPAAMAAVPALIEGLGRGDPGVREQCALALGKLGPAARPSLPALTGALDSPSASLRRAAFLSLSALGPDTAGVARMLHVFRTDVLKDETVRGALVGPDDWMSGSRSEGPALGSVWVSLRALASLGKEAVPGLAAGLKSEDILYRGVCGVVLAMMGPDARAALPALVDLMQDKDPALRRVAIKAAQEVDAHAPTVLAALKEASRDGDEGVKDLAREAVQRYSPLSLRLRTGDRFQVATRLQLKVDGRDPKTDLVLEYTVDATVTGPAVTDPPEEKPDLTAPPGSNLIQWRTGGSPSGAFGSFMAIYQRPGEIPAESARWFEETLPKQGWTLDPSPPAPSSPVVVTGVRRGERISVEIRQSAGVEIRVRVSPWRNGRDQALETTTERGPVALQTRIVRLKAKGTDTDGPVDLDWAESKGAFPPAVNGKDPLASLRELVATSATAAVDRRLRLTEPVRDPLSGIPVFPGASLSGPALLPEDSGRKEDRWATEPDEERAVFTPLDHRLVKSDAGEVVIATTAKLDRPEANGLPALKVDGTATTTFDPRAGLPVKSSGQFVQESAGSKVTVEFETVFTKPQR